MNNVTYAPTENTMTNKIEEQENEKSQTSLKVSPGDTLKDENFDTCMENTQENKTPESVNTAAEMSNNQHTNMTQLLKQENEPVDMPPPPSPHFEIQDSLSTKETTENGDIPLNLNPTASPLTRINRRRTIISTVFPVGCMGCKEDDKQPKTGTEHIQDPNSLGLDNDSAPPGTRRKIMKRKDGNPLLGVGYDDDKPLLNPICKVPPGGFSHGLW